MSNIVRMLKFKKKGDLRGKSSMHAEIKLRRKLLAGNQNGRGIPRGIWEVNVKMGFREIQCVVEYLVESDA